MLSIIKGASFISTDYVLYSKIKPWQKEYKSLIGKLVAIKNPYDSSKVLYRRVIATELLWVKRIDDSGLI